MDGYRTVGGRYALILGPRQMDILRVMLRSLSLGGDAGKYLNGEDRGPVEQMIVTVGSLLGEPIFEGEEIIAYQERVQP